MLYESLLETYWAFPRFASLPSEHPNESQQLVTAPIQRLLTINRLTRLAKVAYDNACSQQLRCAPTSETDSVVLLRSKPFVRSIPAWITYAGTRLLVSKMGTGKKRTAIPVLRTPAPPSSARANPKATADNT